jgi:hypothetical protein
VVSPRQALASGNGQKQQVEGAVKGGPKNNFKSLKSLDRWKRFVDLKVIATRLQDQKLTEQGQNVLLIWCLHGAGFWVRLGKL